MNKYLNDYLQECVDDFQKNKNMEEVLDESFRWILRCRVFLIRDMYWPNLWKNFKKQFWRISWKISWENPSISEGIIREMSPGRIYEKKNVRRNWNIIREFFGNLRNIPEYIIGRLFRIILDRIFRKNFWKNRWSNFWWNLWKKFCSEIIIWGFCLTWRCENL